MASHYTVEVLLKDGATTIRQDVSPEDGEWLGKRNPALLGRVDDPYEDLGRMIYTILFERLRKGTGFLSLVDREGRHWAVPVGSVLAMNVSGFEPERTRRFGFLMDPEV